MVFGWGRNRNNGDTKKKNKKQKKHEANNNNIEELVIPNHFICPISLQLMKDPVTLSSGITYDREYIEAWLEAGNFTCPVTNQVLMSFDQIPNHSLRKMIQIWCEDNQNYGIQRIPTPRVPVSPTQIVDLLTSLADSTNRLDQSECVGLIQKIQNLATQTHRNLQCIVANGTAGALAATFDAFSNNDFETYANVFEVILSTINTLMFPMDFETQVHFSSNNSLHCLVWILQTKDTSSKQNSIIVLKELLASNQQYAEDLSSIEGVKEVLFEFIKNPINSTMTKASLMVIFYLLSTNDKIKSGLVKMGLVSLVLEMIVDSERSTCEKALGVFNKICDWEEGREEAYNNALTWAVLVKKILRVSQLATEYSVSSIWKLHKYGNDSVLVECLQVGAFQKLVLLLQVGCGDETKEKATQLLKLMNPYRNGLECIDSLDFKNLKRSF